MTNQALSRVDDTRERILAAALDVFAERGFDGAKTRDIAARAQVTLGLLQYHFGGKSKLWQAAVDLAFAELRSGLEDVVAGAPGDERERLRRLIRSHVRFVGRNPEFVRLMHDEGKRRGPRMRWLVDRYVRPMLDELVPLIRSCQAQGILAPAIDPIHFVYALIGAVDVIFHQAEECRRATGLDPTEPSAIEAHASAVEALFLGFPTQEVSP